MWNNDEGTESWRRGEEVKEMHVSIPGRKKRAAKRTNTEPKQLSAIAPQ